MIRTMVEQFQAFVFAFFELEYENVLYDNQEQTTSDPHPHLKV
ncbi:hypothetical protein [Alkalihalobacterium bogoriense]|nr:hypothetical protein [Alkalihalobacterium bogoriense]